MLEKDNPQSYVLEEKDRHGNVVSTIPIGPFNEPTELLRFGNGVITRKRIEVYPDRGLVLEKLSPEGNVLQGEPIATFDRRILVGFLNIHHEIIRPA
jgi:hypothetical protein